jgi:uncharacterized damage-inducible protein DinB
MTTTATPTAAPTGATSTTFLFADVEGELASTRRLLEAVPTDRLDWRPHAKSWSLGELAAHVTNLPHWQASILEQDSYDLAASGPRRSAPASREALLADFDGAAAHLRGAMAALPDDALARPWTLRNGEHVIMSAPKAVMARTMGVSHLAHHRGQLTVYLRLLDLPVPGLYGPSADESRG